MIALFSGLFAGLLPKLIAGAVAVAAALAAAFGLYWKIWKSGVQSQQNADLKATLKSVENRNAVEKEVAAESDSNVADDLRKQRRGF